MHEAAEILLCRLIDSPKKPVLICWTDSNLEKALYLQKNLGLRLNMLNTWKNTWKTWRCSVSGVSGVSGSDSLCVWSLLDLKIGLIIRNVVY